MNIISLAHVTPLEALSLRCERSAERLAGPEYRPEAVWTQDTAGWPGDWEGRTLLGQVLISRVLGRVPEDAFRLVALLDSHVNEKGYLGPALPAGEYDEQQLSGHSWLLRGLAECYEEFGSEDALRHLKTVTEALFLPAKEGYLAYPITAEGHVTEGAAGGNIAGIYGGWSISTDTGCAFIPLDGVSHAYHVLRDPAIADLLDIMAERFLALDPAVLGMQTHATLTACRGLLRYGADAHRADLIDAARRIFDLYAEEGMTANYANCNWFGRPSWTEPCAVIDSFMAAMQLYALTEAPAYLNLGRRIALNGLLRGQRGNGGFGTDTCAGPAEGSGNRLAVDIYEASWCCSMRGGEGLARLAQYGVLTVGNAALLTLLLPCRCETALEKGTLAFILTGCAPLTGQASLWVEACPEGCTLSLALPTGVETVSVNGEARAAAGGRLVLSPSAGDTYSLAFDLPLHTEPAPGKANRGTLLLRGDAVLGTDGERLIPLADSALTDAETLAASPLQILF